MIKSVFAGFSIILFCIAILASAIWYKKYSQAENASDIIVPMQPYGSGASVRIHTSGVQFRIRNTDEWKTVFDNSSRVSESSNSTNDLIVISADLGNLNLPRMVHSMGSHRNYLVLDGRSVWHFAFDGQRLINKSFVVEFIANNYNEGIDLRK